MLDNLFKQKKSQEKLAKALYASALSSTREEIFYKEYGVPDSFDGRFDLLLLHIFMILKLHTLLIMKHGSQN